MKQETKKKIKTTVFWSGLVSAIIIFAQSVATLFGYEIPAETIAKTLAAVNSLLAVLSFGGILINPKQVDSFQAMVTKTKK